ncbi:phytanoyl-CoA dioxygenase family protein [Rickettsiales endosymbiont of Stachyamoeba lipophora]|uniref:phytanoyl-CoA dioxygenase family protein n=1 Tax=Rickettsiales endosymbiont of Stachyamoeba lipophora TaxID=2486578 RepID=UPI000F649C82|nr:phytanoyl-CoA dioxygenase family protein [Rickettsiales endosymbiont of Stachyamoeba lipophora]AZL15491.1 hypothetical protein EF513_02840 [Rickettsiales endosymbiont of Stachyamoeba lipophora]
MNQDLSFFKDRELALKFYQENGYFIEKNIFNSDLCDQIIQNGLKLKEDLGNEVFAPLMMPHRHDKLFLEAMAHPKLVEIMSILVGGDVSGLQTEMFFCKPGTRGFASHQDNFFVEAGKEVFASAWVALTDTSYENGGLIAYPGTHKEDILPTRKIRVENSAGQDPNANNEEVVIPEIYKPINAIVPKGAAFFIHGNLVHASNMNQSNGFRYVLLCTYIKTGEPFRPGNHAKRKEIPLSNNQTLTAC